MESGRSPAHRCYQHAGPRSYSGATDALEERVTDAEDADRNEDSLHGGPGRVRIVDARLDIGVGGADSLRQTERGEAEGHAEDHFLGVIAHVCLVFWSLPCLQHAPGAKAARRVPRD